MPYTVPNAVGVAAATLAEATLEAAVILPCESTVIFTVFPVPPYKPAVTPVEVKLDEPIVAAAILSPVIVDVAITIVIMIIVVFVLIC